MFGKEPILFMTLLVSGLPEDAAAKAFFGVFFSIKVAKIQFVNVIGPFNPNWGMITYFSPSVDILRTKHFLPCLTSLNNRMHFIKNNVAFISPHD